MSRSLPYVLVAAAGLGLSATWLWSGGLGNYPLFANPEFESFLPVLRLVWAGLLITFPPLCLLVPGKAFQVLVVLLVPSVLLRFVFGAAISLGPIAMPYNAFDGTNTLDSIRVGVQVATPPDLLMLIWLVIAGPRILLAGPRILLRRNKVSTRVPHWPWMVWLAAGLVVTVFSTNVPRSLTIYYTGYIMPLAFFAAALAWLLLDPNRIMARVTRLAYLMVLGVGVAAVYPTLRTALAIANSESLFDAIRVHRGGGKILPMWTAILAFPLAISLIINARRSRLWLTAGRASLCTTVVAMTVSLARGLFVSVPTVLLTLFWADRRLRRRVVIGALVAVVAGWALDLQGPLLDRTRAFMGPGDTLLDGLVGAYTRRGDAISSSRFDYMRAQLDVFRQHPFAGTGPGSFALHLPYYNLELTDDPNHHLTTFVLAEQGLVGWLATAAVMGAFVMQAVAVRRRIQDRAVRSLVLAMLAGIAGFVVHTHTSGGGLVSTSSLLDQSSAYMFWGMMAMLWALSCVAAPPGGLRVAPSRATPHSYTIDQPPASSRGIRRARRMEFDFARPLHERRNRYVVPSGSATGWPKPAWRWRR